MKKRMIIIVIACIILMDRSFASIEDIENHWAKEYIQDAITNQIVSGYEDNTFKPDNKISKNEFLKMLIESIHLSLEIEENEIWPNAYIATATKYGLVKEIEPKETFTRYDAIKILSKYLKNIEVKNTKCNLKDVESQYKEDISKMLKLKIINGYDDNMFHGNEEMTRAEAIAMIRRTVMVKREKQKNKTFEIEKCILNTNIKKQ